MHEHIYDLLEEFDYGYDKVDDVIGFIRHELGLNAEADQIAKSAQRAYEQATAILNEYIGEA